MTAIVLLVLGGTAWYFTTAEERLRLWRGALSLLLQLKKKVDLHRQEPEPFLDALRARAALPFVTIGLVGIHILAFAFVIVGGAALSDPEGLVAWGGNFGPRTTNGEWWRLVSAMFLHARRPAAPGQHGGSRANRLSAGASRRTARARGGLSRRGYRCRPR